MAKAPYNNEGVEHLHSSDSTPAAEAAEIARHARAMRGVNTHNRSKNEVFNPGDEVGGPKSPGELAREQQLFTAEHDPGNSVVGEATPLVIQARKNLARQQALRTGKPMP